MGKLALELEGQASRSVKRLIRLSLKAAYYDFSFPFDGEVTVSFVSPSEIRELNRAHRGVDRETDVLSFPLMDFYHGECGMAEDEINLDTGRLPLGDVVISLEQARRQGQEFGHGTARECAYLAVHSLLHLLGFDHTDEGSEKALMRSREEKILKKLGLERDKDDN